MMDKLAATAKRRDLMRYLEKVIMTNDNEYRYPFYQEVNHEN